MSWESIDWKALERLRRAFLQGTASAGDYWLRDTDLDSYDQTFAQRIGWKWDFVLDELCRRGWTPPPGDLCDWGCGSGVAARAFLDHFGAESATRLCVWDRSALAMQYASRRAREKFPGLMVAATVPDTPAVLLLSHVLTELKPEQTEMLLQLAQRARAVLWVEPGHYEASLTLIAVRERLRASFHLVAPCTQNARCGILHAGNEPHWCHHFAASPPEVFTDPHWGTFAKLAGVDLRSLPLSFLVLDQRPTPPLPSGALRVIGRPRVNKAEALLLGCDAGGVRERRLAQRDLPETFRGLKKGQHYSLAICRQEGERVLEIAPAFLPA